MMADKVRDPLRESLPNVHEVVRQSELMCALHEKTGELNAGAFQFVAAFGALREVVAPQIGDTRLLFPEFTPHDEPLHVAQLFQLADRLIGKDIYRQFNAAELFLLACALYTHDWGMAVGRQEQDYLRQGLPEALLPASDGGAFAPLKDEAQRLNAFARENGITAKDGQGRWLVDEEQLRSYVRLTHAQRSGARARRHFREHSAIGEALAHLCEGHWHDFAVLDDAERFPREYQVAGLGCHLLALACYVRLIDLFHLTDDRTPYNLWRFVCPRDRRSAEEWRKHRALTGVSVSEYRPGRAIRVQGYTDSPETWAALQDLRHYCDEQVDGTLELSARHVPERYHLNFVKLDWAVTTGELEPVDFRFDFDRSAMFRILSDDIYSGDCRVFLRELLQNAIDAVRVRRARHRQRQQGGRRRLAEPTFDTTIYFDAQHLDSGDIIVTCRDQGIGMDEHIIRNYFTVAGVSYYRSAEFQRQNLGFEPISRFGIGILSCFMVADALEVKTYRDPEVGLPGNSQSSRPSRIKLHLQVPGVDRQFVVKSLAEDFGIGTEVKLRLSADKLRDHAGRPEAADPASEVGHAGPFRRSIEIAECLCHYAGFVDLPILVTETWPGLPEPRSTLILHPDCDAESEAAKCGGDVHVHQLCVRFPWEHHVAPECMAAARELFTELVVSLPGDEAADGVEGWVCIPLPRERGMGATFYPASTVWCIGQDEYDSTTIYCHAHEMGIRLYRDGIFVCVHPWPFEATDSPFWSCINLPATERFRLNAARDEVQRPVPWTKVVGERLGALIDASYVQEILTEPPPTRFLLLGWLDLVLKGCTGLWRVPAHLVPVPILLPPTRVEWREGAPAEPFRVLPRDLGYASLDLLGLALGRPDRYCREVWEWRGAPAVMRSYSDSPGFRENAIDHALRLVSRVVYDTAEPVRVEFLLPTLDSPPSDFLIQPILQHYPRRDPLGEAAGALGSAIEEAFSMKRSGQTLPRETILQALGSIVTEGERLSDQDLIDASVFLRLCGAIFPDQVVEFAAPFDAHFVAGTFVNAGHPMARVLVRCAAAIHLAELASPVLTLSERYALRYGGGVTDANIKRLVHATVKYQLIPGFERPRELDGLERVSLGRGYHSSDPPRGPMGFPITRLPDGTIGPSLERPPVE